MAAGSTESVSGKNKKTERGGFEPPKAFDLTRLPIVHLRPLGHLSNSSANYIRKAFDFSSSVVFAIKLLEYRMVYRAVCYSAFFPELSVVAKDDGPLYVVVLVFNKGSESTMYRIVLSWFHLYWKNGEVFIVVHKEIDLSLLPAVV